MTDEELLIDVLGVGNALVDVLSHADEELIEQLRLSKGAMTLVDEPRFREVYDAMGPGVEVSGGSAANTLVGLASLGGRGHYVGRVADDQLGRVFSHDIRANGVDYSTAAAVAGAPTGSCLILVTPDAQRTMSTFLGASAELGPEDIDADLVRRAKVLYLEGYLFDPPRAQEAYWVASRIASDAGGMVALTLSDPFCVERHRGAFRDLVAHHVDLLFANEAEICALYEVEDFGAALDHVRGDCRLAALTRSAKGSVLVSGDTVVEIDAEPVEEVVDTTGAGDQYAAGVLYGVCRGLDLETCGRLGSIAAAEVIGHMGARPEADLKTLATALLPEGD